MFTSLLDFLLLKQWIPAFYFLKLRLAPVHKSRYKTPASANKDRILVKSFMCVQVSVTLLPTSSGILFPSFLEEADAVPDVVSFLCFQSVLLWMTLLFSLCFVFYGIRFFAAFLFT